MEQITLLTQTPAQSAIPSFVMMAAIAVIFYVLLFMPMRKRQKKVESMIAAIKKGDKVITSSGIYGFVAAVKEKTFIIEIADDVKIEVAKSAVAGLQDPE